MTRSSNLVVHLAPGLFLLLTAAAACRGSAQDGKTHDATKPPMVTTAATTEGQCGTGLSVSPDTPVAYIAGKPVLCSELIAKDGAAVKSSETDFLQEVNSIHTQYLNQMIDERLFAAKAKEAGVDVDAYVKAQIAVEPTSDAEIQEVYDRTVQGGQELPPIDQVRDDISQFVMEQKQAEKLKNLRNTLRGESEVEISLPLVLPTAQDVEAIGPSKGPESAPVTIVEFSDFQCPFCGKAEPTVERILETYGDKVRLVYRDYPLPRHPNAPKASEAALCAQEQGKYWEMHKTLFAHQKELSVPDLKSYAGTLGLDMAAFNKCLDSGAMHETIVASTKAGSDVGVNGTPAFFVNGRLLSGAQPYERFKEIIDYELAHLDEAAKAAAPGKADSDPAAPAPEKSSTGADSKAPGGDGK